MTIVRSDNLHFLSKAMGVKTYCCLTLLAITMTVPPTTCAWASPDLGSGTGQASVAPPEIPSAVGADASPCSSSHTSHSDEGPAPVLPQESRDETPRSRDQIRLPLSLVVKRFWPLYVALVLLVATCAILAFTYGITANIKYARGANCLDCTFGQTDRCTCILPFIRLLFTKKSKKGKMLVRCPMRVRCTERSPAELNQEIEQLMHRHIAAVTAKFLPTLVGSFWALTWLLSNWR